MTILQHNKAGYSSLFYGIPLLLILLISPLVGHAEDLAEITDVRHWENRDFVRFVFDISKPVEFTNGKLSNPERLFFDLKNSKLAKGLRKSFEINYEFVKSVRIGQYSTDTARIVFDCRSRHIISRS